MTKTFRLMFSREEIAVYSENVTDWAVSRRRIGKHVPTNAHPTIEVRPFLGNRPVKTSQQRMRNNRASIARQCMDRHA
jgi:hypothetical protein